MSYLQNDATLSKSNRFHEDYNTNTVKYEMHINVKDAENFVTKNEISLSPLKTVTKPLLPYTAAYSGLTARSLLTMSRTTSKPESKGSYFKPGRKTEFGKKLLENKNDLSTISLEDGSKTARRTDFKFFRTHSTGVTPQRNTVLPNNQHKKRRRIKNPVTHIPYNERDSEESHDNFNVSNESFEEIKKALNEEDIMDVDHPQSGVESGGKGVDFDNITAVYQNQERIADAEKPMKLPTKRPKKPKATCLSQEKVSEFCVKPKQIVVQKHRRVFSMGEVKEYLDELEDYEKSRKKNEGGKKNEDDRNCVECSIF